MAMVLFHKMRPTKRAPDVWDSAAFSSIFLASSFSCSQAESTPAHTQVTQTVSQPRAKQNTSLIRMFCLGESIFFGVAVFNS
jgi:hypothetical protein